MPSRTNTDLIRELGQVTAELKQRVDNHDGQFTNYANDVADLRRELRQLQNLGGDQNVTAARIDERLKQVEVKLERRWNLLLALAGGLGGILLAQVLQWL